MARIPVLICVLLFMTEQCLSFKGLQQSPFTDGAFHIKAALKTPEDKFEEEQGIKNQMLLSRIEKLEKQKNVARSNYEALREDMGDVNTTVQHLLSRIEKVEARSTSGYYCPENWVRYHTSCYLIDVGGKAWAEASLVCAVKGAHLAAVETSEENNFIRGHIMIFYANLRVWLGGTQVEKQGTWKWSPGGKVMTFTDWYPGQPEQNGGDCLIIWPGHSYHWGDIACSHTAGFICEKPLLEAS